MRQGEPRVRHIQYDRHSCPSTVPRGKTAPVARQTYAFSETNCAGCTICSQATMRAAPAPPRSYPCCRRFATSEIGSIRRRARVPRWCCGPSLSARGGRPWQATGSRLSTILIERSPDRPTLVVCLHPKCPCSRATLAEIERLLARPAVAATHPEVLAVLTIPADGDDSWTSAKIVQRCRRLPESRVEFDRGGRIAAAFGAATSGEVLLFDAAGARLFAGGVTVSRGQEGRSSGGDALAALLEGTPSTTASTPVFGCRLVASPKGDLQQCKRGSIPIANPLRAIAHISAPALTQSE
jgi:hypothetical protein